MPRADSDLEQPLLLGGASWEHRLGKLEAALSEKERAVRQAQDHRRLQEEHEEGDDDENGEPPDCDNQLLLAHTALIQARVDSYTERGRIIDSIQEQRKALGCFAPVVAACCCCFPHCLTAAQLQETEDHLAAAREQGDAKHASEYSDAYSEVYRQKRFLQVEKMNIDAELEQCKAQSASARRGQNHARIDELRQQERQLIAAQQTQQERISTLE
eukprot:COSAG02_NODE_7238_length_3103_cov_1.651899_2_plen_214_part_01